METETSSDAFGAVIFNDYPSQSEADLALCRLLAFYTNCDAGEIDRLFRQSGLYRPKWDEPHFAGGKTYGQATIEKAVSSADERYAKPWSIVTSRGWTA